jgi:hypothetical protein
MRGLLFSIAEKSRRIGMAWELQENDRSTREGYIRNELKRKGRTRLPTGTTDGRLLAISSLRRASAMSEQGPLLKSETAFPLPGTPF